MQFHALLLSSSGPDLTIKVSHWRSFGSYAGDELTSETPRTILVAQRS